MKKVIYTITIILLFLQIEGFTQTCKKVSHKISGKFEAHCVFKTLNTSSVSHCELCPIQLNNDKTSLLLQEFYMIFEADQLTLVIHKDTTEVALKYNNRFSKVKFKFKNKHYKFQLYSGAMNINFILKNQDDNLILLERI